MVVVRVKLGQMVVVPSRKPLVQRTQKQGVHLGQNTQARQASQTHYGAIEAKRVLGGAVSTQPALIPSALRAAKLERWLCPATSTHHPTRKLHEPLQAQKTKHSTPNSVRGEFHPPLGQNPATGCVGSFFDYARVQEQQMHNQTNEHFSGAHKTLF